MSNSSTSNNIPFEKFCEIINGKELQPYQKNLLHQLKQKPKKAVLPIPRTPWYKTIKQPKQK